MNLKTTIFLPSLLLLLLPSCLWGKNDALSSEDKSQPTHVHCENKLNCIAADKELVRYQSVIDRLSTEENPDGKEKEEMGRAYNQMASVYIFHFYDYGRALECLSKARALYGTHPSTDLLINIAHLANFYSECIPTKENTEYALSAYQTAFHQAVARKEWGNAYRSFNNACCIGYTDDIIRYNRTLIDSFNVLPKLRDPWLMKFSHFVYLTTVALRDHQWDKATSLFQQMLAAFPDNKENSRVRCQALSGLADIAIMQHQPKSLLHYITQLKALVDKYNNPDVQKEISLFSYQYYLMRGDTTKARLYKLDYFEQRDSMLYQGRLAGVRTTFLVNRLQAAHQEMNVIRQHLLRRNIIIIAALLSLLVFFWMLLMVYKKNKELKLRNLELYRHNIASLEREKEQQDMILRLQNSHKPKSAAMEGKNRDPKALFSEEELTAIRCKVEEALNNPEIISKTDFSIDQMAQLCSMNGKLLSRAINECFHRSFSILLSESRIKEACKRINDFERYGNLTIEAISQSVGFSSRGGFIRAFKRSTGLTPSEYMAIAKNQKNKH